MINSAEVPDSDSSRLSHANRGAASWTSDVSWINTKPASAAAGTGTRLGWASSSSTPAAPTATRLTAAVRRARAT